MVDRLAAVLEHVARSEQGMTLTELARAVDAPVSSIQGLVNGLAATGYLDERDRRYSLGTAPYLLNLIAGRHMVTRIDHAVLESIHASCGLTTLLSIAVSTDVFYIDNVSREPRYDYLAKNFIRRSLIRTSAGWVLLADFTRRDLWTYLSSLPPEDEERVERFLAALDEIRETGVCAGPHTSEVADGVSIAVRESGRTTGAVSIVGSEEEIGHRRQELTDLLVAHRERWDSRP
nr:helix-turn-helix domain-containing protein [Nocardioides carbamazepini]